MTQKKKSLFVGLLAMLMIAFLAGPAISTDSVTIIGTVNDNYQIVTDNGQAYAIAEGKKGDELVELVGKKVKATGIADEVDGEKIIEVTSYEVIEK